MYKYFLHSTSVIVGDGEDRERRARETESANGKKKITKFESRAQQRKNNFFSGSDRKHSEFSFHPLIINSSKRQPARGQRRRGKSAGKKAAPRRRGALRAIISRVHPHMNEKLTRF